MGVSVVPRTETFVLRQKWRELDGAGYEAANADPFNALRAMGFSYGHAANPGMAGYVYRAWVRAPGVSKPMQATGTELLTAMLSLLCRALLLQRPLN